MYGCKLAFSVLSSCICTQLIMQLVWRGAKQKHGKSFLEAELGTSP